MRGSYLVILRSVMYVDRMYIRHRAFRHEESVRMPRPAGPVVTCLVSRVSGYILIAYLRMCTIL